MTDFALAYTIAIAIIAICYGVHRACVWLAKRHIKDWNSHDR